MTPRLRLSEYRRAAGGAELPVHEVAAISRARIVGERAFHLHRVALNTFTVPAPALMYWQSRHQQCRVNSGSASILYRTAPQRHPPVMVMCSSLAIMNARSRGMTTLV